MNSRQLRAIIAELEPKVSNLSKLDEERESFTPMPSRGIECVCEEGLKPLVRGAIGRKYEREIGLSSFEHRGSIRDATVRGEASTFFSPHFGSSAVNTLRV